MRKLRYLGVVCVVALAFGACGDDGINTLPDGATLDDRDSDSILDNVDNCPDDANGDQVNTDGDADGDACDPDDDNDGVPDGADNCPIVANPDQANDDGDADGDACDGDADGDKVADDSDNCPGVANVDQLNTDGDAEGDACDPDDDNDTLLDVADNCPLAANLDQLDSDEDSNGNACDDDDDNDTVLDVDDNCPIDSNVDQANADGDTDGDACDVDADNDGVVDVDDNCVDDANAGQEDNDLDELGDVCDSDDDNDGIGDEGDNCPLDANGDQADLDFDALGDVCDTDDDGDTVLDVDDNCQFVANENQQDGDDDGSGDACDLTTVVSEAVIGQNLIAVGSAWSAREDLEVKTSADLAISNLPANATIRTAFLYWTVIGVPFPTVTFDGTQVTGVEIGQTPDTCWEIGNNFAYRADVTAQITGNKTYTVTDILSALDGPDGQGASLVITYVDPADPRSNFVKISDGALGFAGSGVTTVIVSTIDGFTLAQAPDAARVVNLVADGQPFGEELKIQDVEFGAGDPFFGADGNLWDTRIDDVTSLVPAGSTAVTTTLFSENDCLAWSMNAVVIENFVPVAVPLAPPTSVQTGLKTKAKAAMQQSAKPATHPVRAAGGMQRR